MTELINTQMPRKAPDNQTPTTQKIEGSQKEHQSTSLIDIGDELTGPATPQTEDEDSDDDLGHKIRMVDLDPEPILE